MKWTKVLDKEIEITEDQTVKIGRGPADSIVYRVPAGKEAIIDIEVIEGEKKTAKNPKVR